MERMEVSLQRPLTPLEKIATKHGSGGSLALRVKDAFPVILAHRRMWKRAPRTQYVRLRRTYDGAEVDYDYSDADQALINAWTQQNMLATPASVDGTFEHGGTENWVAYGANDIRNSADYAHGGTKSLRIEYVDSANGALFALRTLYGCEQDAEVGHEYYCEYWVRAEGGDVQGVIWDGGAYAAATTIIDGAGWTKVSATFIAASATGCFIRIQSMGAGEVAYVDDIVWYETKSAVPKWYDQSGNANGASQSTAADQYIFDKVNRKQLSDGSTDDFIIQAGVIAQPFTIIMRGTFTYGASQYHFGNVGARILSYGGKWAIWAGSYMDYVNADNHTNISAVFNGASSFLLVDGVKTTGNPGATGMSGDSRLGAYHTGVNNADADFNAFVLCKYALTEEEINQVLNFLSRPQ